jgi:hypothetical protein
MTDHSAPRPVVRRIHRLTMVVALVGLLLTGLLTWGAWNEYNRTESRLLSLRTRDAGLVLSSAVTDIQTPLASAAELAHATGNLERVRQFVAPYVSAKGPFVSVSLWPLGTPASAPVAVVGVPPDLHSGPMQQAFFARESKTAKLSVVGVLHGASGPRLGYAFSTPGQATGYVAYAETRLPPHRRAQPGGPGTPFANFNFALYLGNSVNPAALLESTVAHLPLPGQEARARIPFGDTDLTLVMSSNGSLQGSLPERLPLIIALSGLALTAVAAVLAEWLVRRRLAAEALAARLDVLAEENRALYAEQRGIAETLQRSLLPAELPVVGGIRAAAVYRPGEKGLEVGGDWYDLVQVDEHRALAVIGDVSGRGVRAATVMAALRYAIRAYAVQGDPPEHILAKLSSLISLEGDGHFATVLCALVDVSEGTVSVANAGHLPPLLISSGRAEYVETEVGVPVGVVGEWHYARSTLPAGPGSTLLLFTDGLVERRGEHLDVGLKRLRESAEVRQGDLAAVVRGLADDMTPTGSVDDVALLGVRWN